MPRRIAPEKVWDWAVKGWDRMGLLVVVAVRSGRRWKGRRERRGRLERWVVMVFTVVGVVRVY